MSDQIDVAAANALADPLVARPGWMWDPDLSEPLISKVTDDLWIGGSTSPPAVLPAEVTDWLTLTREATWEVRHELRSRELAPFQDEAVLPPLLSLAERVAWVRQRRSLPGTVVLVTCLGGFNRSGLIVALSLIDDGMTAADAVALLREKRGKWALTNRTYRDWLLA